MKSRLRYVSLILAFSLALGVLPTPATAETYPSAPRNLTATEGDGEVSLSWSSPSDNGGATVTGYKVFRGTSSGAGNQNIITSGGCASPTSRSCTDSGLTNGQRYYYIVSAVNSAGQGAPSNEADARPEAEESATLPSAPRSLSATAGTGEVSLTWSRPSDDGGATIESYRVFRGTSSGAGNQNIITSGGCASPTSRSCTDSGLTNGQRYYYIVSAVNSEGQGAPSNEASATTTGTAPPSTTYPDAPTGLSASPGNGQVSLTWSAPSNNGGASVTNYKVFRGTTSGLGNQLIVTSGGCASLGNVLSCTDTGLTSGQAYYYRVSAVSSVGQGPTSNEATATTTGTPQAVTYPGAPTGLAAFGGNSQVGLGWNAPSSNGGSAVTNYKVFRGTTGGLGNQNLVTSGGCANLGTQLSCTDTGLNSGQTYYYRVSAVNNVGQGPTSNEATTTTTGEPSPSATLPGAPRNLDAYGDAGQNYLGWNAPASDGGAVITNYRVFRTTSPDSSPSIVTTGGCANLGVTFACTDTGLINGQAYYYTVSAVNGIGQGAPSNQVSATTTGMPGDEEPQLANLVVHPISFNPNPPVAGQSVDVTCSYGNSPNAASTQTGFSVQVSIDGETPKTATSGALSPGGSGANTFTFTEAYGAGPHAVVCEVNKNRAVVESDYGNSGTTITKTWVAAAASAEQEEPAAPPLAPPNVQTQPRSGTGYFFIHGICSTGAMWDQQFGKGGKPNHGHAVWAPLTKGGAPYLAPTYGPDIDDDQVSPRGQVVFLKRELEQFVDSENLAHVVLVGHSNGGLMARALLAAEVGTKYEQLIKRVVTIDSPDLGGDKTTPKYAAMFNVFCKDYEGSAQSGWMPYTMTFLDRDGLSGVGWMSDKHSGAVLSDDHAKVVRFVFGHCWGLFTASLIDLKPPGCTNGEEFEDGILAALSTEDANLYGAVLLGYIHPTDSSSAPDAVQTTCAESRLGNDSDKLLAIGLRTQHLKFDQGIFDVYHSWGIEYYAGFIAQSARAGLTGFFAPHGLDSTTYDCSVFRSLPNVAAAQIAALVTLTPEAPEVTGSAASVITPRNFWQVLTQTYEPGFTVTAASSENTLNGVRLKVNSDTHPGKVVVINIDPAFWKGPTPNDVGVWLDDLRVRVAWDYADLTSDTSATSPAKYLFVQGAAGPQLLIWVPHFSERTIEIMAIEQDLGQAFVTPLGMLAMAAAAGVLVAGAYGFGRRRRRGPNGGIHGSEDGASESGDEPGRGTFMSSRSAGMEQPHTRDPTPPSTGSKTTLKWLSVAVIWFGLFLMIQNHNLAGFATGWTMQALGDLGTGRFFVLVGALALGASIAFPSK